MKQMSNNKSPGWDGLSKEFYSAFWNMLGGHLVDVYNTAYTNNNLPESYKRAIISLLLGL